MYDHLKNAGNVFDVFKHGLLMKAVEYDPPSLYFESHCGYASYSKPELWESSWIKVQRETKCGCILCDINPEVITFNIDKANDIEPFFFIYADGFEEAKKFARIEVPPDLFFIDPPYKDDSDWNKVTDLTTYFSETRNCVNRVNRWIVWYPIFANGLTFKSQVPAVEMYWTTPENLHGCGMAFGGDFNETDMENIHSCLGFLQWCTSATRVEKINGT